jgi:glucose-1-phosphate thymidylyltransferase
MKLIIPMAGRGSRLKPHTLTTPKPLISIAGKTIVERLVNDAVKLVNEPVEEMAFIVGDPLFFGKTVIKELEKLAKSHNSKATIYRQLNPLGTGHAIMCAEESLKGKALVIYPDTLIRTNESFDKNADAVIWTKQVANPEAYGVVKLNKSEEITALIEKPSVFVSDLAVIGIYYFKEIAQLKEQLRIVIKNNKMHSGEFQINDGLLGMMADDKKFKVGKVSAWLDCGNVKSTITSNKEMLNFLKKDKEQLTSDLVNMINSKVIEPCYISSNVTLENSTIGPHVSINSGCKISNATVSNSIIGENTILSNADISNSMIGNNCKYDGRHSEINIGDFSELN